MPECLYRFYGVNNQDLEALFGPGRLERRQRSNDNILTGFRTSAHGMKPQNYHNVIGAALLLLAATGSVILYQRHKQQELHATAESTFYEHEITRNPDWQT